MRPSFIPGLEVLCFLLQVFFSLSHGHLQENRSLRPKRQALIGNSQSQRILNEIPTGNSVPNAWLYRFPPWSFPHNPPPDGFAPPDVKDIPNDLESPSLDIPLVEDGDVIIVSEFELSDRQGRLLNVKVPGRTAFRDEVVQTVVDYSLGKLPKQVNGNDGSVSQNGITIQDVTPVTVSHNNNIPVQSVPSTGPTSSFNLQPLPNSGNQVNGNVFFGQPLGGNVRVTNNFGQPLGGNVRVTNNFGNGNNIQQPQFIVSQRPPRVQVTNNFGNGNHIQQPQVIVSQRPRPTSFRPSPPDLSLGTSSFNGFRPSSIGSRVVSTSNVLPVRRQNPGLVRINGNSQVVRSRPGVRFTFEQQRPAIQSNNISPFVQHNIINGGTLQNARLQNVVSPGFSPSKPIQNHFGNGIQHIWVPGAQNTFSTGLRQQQTGAFSLNPNHAQHLFRREVTQKPKGGSLLKHRVRIQNHNEGTRVGQQPTSIQDIINNNHDPLFILQGEKNSGSLHPSSVPNSWLWPASSQTQIKNV